MDLSLNDTQQLIQDSARDFVRGACDRDVLLKLDRNPAAMTDGIWRQMSELGWTGMAIPETLELPPCIYCGHAKTTEVTPKGAPELERWYECAECLRRFAVQFIATPPGGES